MVCQNPIRKGAPAPSPLSAPLAHQHFRVTDVLDTEVTLWVPSRTKRGDPLDHPRVVAIVQEKFLNLFGGATAVTGQGSTRLLTGNQTEKITLVTSFTTEAILSEKWPSLCELIERMLRAYQQAAILVRVSQFAFLFNEQGIQEVNHAA